MTPRAPDDARETPRDRLAAALRHAMREFTVNGIANAWCITGVPAEQLHVFATAHEAHAELWRIRADYVLDALESGRDDLPGTPAS